MGTSTPRRLSKGHLLYPEIDFSSRSSSDQRSGRGFSYEAQFTRAMLQMDTCRKIADSPVLREKSTISPRNVSDGKWPLPRIHEKIISRDTKLPFGRSSQKSQRIISACQAFRTSPGILHIGEISERRLVHPLMMCFEMINLIISEVPSPTVLSLESRQCRWTSNSSA